MRVELQDIIENGIATDLFKTERAIAIHKKIGEYSNGINKSESFIKSPIVYLQNLTFNEAVLSLSRIYDNPNKKYNTRCILSIINKLKDKPQNAPEIIETNQTCLQLTKYNYLPLIVKKVQEKNHIEFAKYFANHLFTKYYYHGFQDKIKELRKVRDKTLSHNEAQKVILKVNWKTFDELILFAQSIVGILGWAYFMTAYSENENYVLSRDAKLLSFNLEKLFKELNV